MNRSVLSAGLVIYEVLNETKSISESVTKIFPVMTDTATLPYIAYRRTGTEAVTTKSGNRHRAQIEILCMTETYAEGVELAEKVRKALDFKQITGDSGLVLNLCTMVDASETWSEDAFVQILTFEIETTDIN